MKQIRITKWKFDGSRGPAILACLIVVVAVSAIFSFRAIERQTLSRELVIRAYKVIAQIEQIDSTLKDAETGQRGYLLTGSKNYLQPYLSASQNIIEAINKLKEMTADNPEQQGRVGMLMAKTQDKLAELKETIELKDSRGIEAAMQVVRSNRGQEAMDEIRKISSEMASCERSLLARRSLTLDSSTAKAKNIALALNITTMVVLIILVVLVQVFLNAQRAVEQKLLIQYSVSRILNESITFTDASHRILKSVCERLGWSAAATWLVNEEEGVINCLDIWCVSRLDNTDFIAQTKGQSFALGEGLLGRVWSSGQIILSKDVTEDAHFRRKDSALQSGLRGAVTCPIQWQGRVLGVVEFFSDKVQKTDAQLLAMFEVIGQEIGYLLQRQESRMQLAESERALKENKLLFQEMSDNIRDIFWISDAKGAVPIFVSKAYEEIYGRSVQSLFDNPKTFFDAAHPDDREALKEHIKKQRTDTKPCELEFRVVRPNGEIRWLWVRSISVVDVDGQTKKLCGITSDITFKKEAESRVSEFYSNVSHELRTPLTSIRGSLGLIEGGLTGNLPDKCLRLIKIARIESDRLIRLINDILDIRKIEAGALDLKKTTVETQRLVERTIENIRGMAESAGVNLIARLNTSGPTLCDEDRIIQVLTNLISNAMKFSKAGDDITICLDPGRGNSFKFLVIDHGPGIPASQMHKLFGRFQQLEHTGKRRKEGTGLGLSISKSIVEEHGGTIGVESEVGEGAVFWFELPATFAPVSRAIFDRQSPAVGVRPVLVIEDEYAISEVLAEHLRMDGFEVAQAKSLKEADSILKTCQPLIILLDLNLPDGDGLDLLHKLAVDEQRKNIPVVILTGRDINGKLTYGHPALIDWLPKPFDENELHRALAIAKEKIGPASVLLVEDDPSTREVLVQQMQTLGVNCIVACDGAEAVSFFRTHNPDLIILDLAIPAPDGYGVVDIINREPNRDKPLIVYTASDLNEQQRLLLKLGLTAYLTKGTTSSELLISTVRSLLKGLLSPEKSDAKSELHATQKH